MCSQVRWSHIYIYAVICIYGILTHILFVYSPTYLATQLVIYTYICCPCMATWIRTRPPHATHLPQWYLVGAYDLIHYPVPVSWWRFAPDERRYVFFLLGDNGSFSFVAMTISMFDNTSARKMMGCFRQNSFWFTGNQPSRHSSQLFRLLSKHMDVPMEAG